MQRFLYAFTFSLFFSFTAINSAAQCTAGEVEVTIDVSTDDYGYEIYWELVPSGNGCGNGTIFAGGNTAVGCNGGGLQNQNPGGYGDNVTITEGPWCLIDGSNYDIVWVDDWGDAGASFEVNIEGFPMYSFQGTGTGNTFTFNASVPNDYDLEMTSFDIYPYVGQGNVPIEGTITNVGQQTITSFDLNYSVDGGAPVTQNVTGVSIAPFTTYDFSHSTPWNAQTIGSHNVAVWTAQPNGNTDQDMSNDTLSEPVEVGEAQPNIIDDYLTVTPTFTVIGTSGDGLTEPRDLAFHPNFTMKQLWVINKETENSGGSTVTFDDAGTTQQSSEWKQDGNAWHFMSLPTGIAFGENTNFATSPGVFDANHNGGAPFTGPTLWSSDPAIYAQPSGGNGSHLDMLHESPEAQGIAHEIDNVYWVVDGFNGDIVRYDFVDDHGPGNSYHGDAIIRRYSDFTISKDPNDHIVSHCELDKSTGWLYIVDHGNQKVVRLDINSGTVSGSAPSFGPHETIAEYSAVTGYTYEDVVTTGLVEPAGIDIMDDRMIVSDHSNGDIIIYDISSIPATELGRINTPSGGVMGLTIGPEGKIWYVNTTTEEVVRIDGQGLGLDGLQASNSINIYPNPNNGSFSIAIEGKQISDGQITVINSLGQVVKRIKVDMNSTVYRVNEDLSSGMYHLNLLTAEGSTVESINFIVR